MFNNKTYTNFKPAYKHTVNLWWSQAQKFKEMLKSGVSLEVYTLFDF